MKKDIQRLDSLKKLMEIKNLDGLVFFHPENILLGSGMFPAAPFTVCLVLNTPLKVLVVSPWWRKEEVIAQSWADQCITFNWLKSLKSVDPVATLLNILQKVARKYKTMNIGYDADMGCYMPTYTPSSFFSYHLLKSKVNGSFKKIVDVSRDIHSIRAVKTNYEIQMIRKASLVAKVAAKAFYLNANEDLSEIDVASKVLQAVQEQAGKNRIKFTYCDPPQITSGVKRTAKSFALTCPATRRRLKNGDLVMLELGGCADGYWFDLTRTLVVGGKPRTVHLDMVQALTEATRNVYAAYKNNTKDCNELAKIAFKILKNKGFQKGIVHGLGHGVGFAYHEALPGIGPGSADEIKTGMITSMEPGLYLPEIGGVRIEENILWKDNSISILTDFHNGLHKWRE